MSAELTPETQSHETTPSSTPTTTSTTSSGQGSGGGGRAGLRGMGFEAQTAALKPGGGAVQRKGNGGGAGDVHAAAAHGISGSGGSMPYGAQIQQAFGGYDISQVQAHTDSAAAEGSAAMGADAYATGNHVAFGGAPDLHTAAHEAAHVVQQQAGVSLSGGVGAAGDPYEQHADAVADAVVAGQSAEPILAQMAGAPGGGGGGVQRMAVQLKKKDRNKNKSMPKTGGAQTPGDNEQKTDNGEGAGPASAAERERVALRFKDDVDPRLKRLNDRFNEVKAANVELEGVSDLETAVSNELKSSLQPARDKAAAGTSTGADLADAEKAITGFINFLKETEDALDKVIHDEADACGDAVAVDFRPLAKMRSEVGEKIDGAKTLGLESASISLLCHEFDTEHGRHEKALGSSTRMLELLKARQDALKFAPSGTEMVAKLDKKLADHIQVFKTSLANEASELEKEHSDRMASMAAPASFLENFFKHHVTMMENELNTLRGLFKTIPEAVDKLPEKPPEGVSRSSLDDTRKAYDKNAKMLQDEFDELKAAYESILSFFGTRETEVGASKAAAKAPDSTYDALYRTTRFGDQTLSDAERNKQVLGEVPGLPENDRLPKLVEVDPALQGLLPMVKPRDSHETDEWAKIWGPGITEVEKQAGNLEWSEGLTKPTMKENVADIRKLEPPAATATTSLKKGAKYDGGAGAAFATLFPELVTKVNDLQKKVQPLYNLENDIEAWFMAVKPEDLESFQEAAYDEYHQQPVTFRTKIEQDDSPQGMVARYIGKGLFQFHGRLAEIGMSDTEKLLTVVMAVPRFRQAFVNAIMLKAEGSTAGSSPSEAGLKAGKEAAEALGPAAHVMKDLVVPMDGIDAKLDAAARGDKVLEHVRTFVKTWGEAGKDPKGGNPVLAAARTHAKVLGHFGKLDTERLSVANIMLETGKGLSFKAAAPADETVAPTTDSATDGTTPEGKDKSNTATPDGKTDTGANAGGGYVYEDGSAVEPEVQLDLASMTSKDRHKAENFPLLIKSVEDLKATLETARQAYVAAKAAEAKMSPPPAKPAKPDEAAEKKRTTFVTRCAKTGRISNFVKAVGTGLEKPYLEVLGFHWEIDEVKAKDSSSSAGTTDAKTTDGASGGGETPAVDTEKEKLETWLAQKEGVTENQSEKEDREKKEQAEKARKDQEEKERKDALEHTNAGWGRLLPQQMGSEFRLPDVELIKDLVGSPPDPARVTAALDRVQEHIKKPYFASEDWNNLPKELKAEIRVALGYDKPVDKGFAEALGQLVFCIDNLKKSKALGLAAIGNALKAAGTQAATVFNAVTNDTSGAAAKNTLVAPNGRTPPTARMVLLNVFSAKSEQMDLISWLEVPYDPGVVSKVVGAVFGIFSTKPTELPGLAEFRQGMSDALGLTVEVRTNNEGSKKANNIKDDAVDVQDGVSASDRQPDGALHNHPLLGNVNFISKEMKVPPGFDSYVALRIAENTHDILNLPAAVLENMRDKSAKAADLKAEAAKSLGISSLSGAMAGVLAEIGKSPNAKTIFIQSLQGINGHSRDAVDQAFQARYGRTLAAEFKRHTLEDETKTFMLLEADDPHNGFKKDMESLLLAKKVDAFFAALAKATPAQRASLDPAIRIDDSGQPIASEAQLKTLELHDEFCRLLKELADEAAVAKFKRFLTGAVDLENVGSTDVLHKNAEEADGIVVDSAEDLKKEITNHIQMILSVINDKYPDALKKPGEGKQAAHAAAVAAEQRVALYKLVTGDWSKFLKSESWWEFLKSGGKGIITVDEFNALQALILSGGTEDKGQKILDEWRKTEWYQGKSPDAIKTLIQGLSAAERKQLAADLEVRAAIQQTMKKPEDAAYCLSLLEGGIDSEMADVTPKIWVVELWAKMNPETLLSKVRAMDFDTWTRLRQDDAAMLELLDKLKGEHLDEFRRVMKLEGAGLKSEAGLEAVPGDATETSLAKARFFLNQTKMQLLADAKKGQEKHNASGLLAGLQTFFVRTDKELALKPDTTKPEKTVRGLLADDSELSSAAAACFGPKLWPTFEKAWKGGLDGTVDPAPAVVKYNSRLTYQTGEEQEANKSAGKTDDDVESGHEKLWKDIKNSGVTIGADPAAIAAGIKGAGAYTFVMEFSNLPENDTFKGEVLAWQAEKDTAAKAQIARKASRTLLKPSKELQRTLETVTIANKTRNVVEDAFKAKAIEVLGSTSFENVDTGSSHRATINKAIAEITGIPAESIGNMWRGIDFEVVNKLADAKEKSNEAQDNTLAIGKGDEKDAIGKITANMTSTVVDDSSQNGGDLTEKSKKAVDSGKALVDELHTEIESRAKQVKGYAVASAKFFVSTAANFFMPGAPLYAKLLQAVGKLAINAGTAITEGTGWKGFVTQCVQDGVSLMAGEALSMVSQLVDWSLPAEQLFDANMWKEVIGENELLIAAVQGGIDSVKETMTKGLAQAAAMESQQAFAIAIERGMKTYLKQTIANLGEGLKKTLTEGKYEFITSVLDKMGTAVTDEIKKSLSKDMLKMLGIEEDAKKDPLVKDLDENKDGKILDEVKALQNTTGWERHAASIVKAAKAIPETALEIPIVAALVELMPLSFLEDKASTEVKLDKDGKPIVPESMRSKLFSGIWKDVKKLFVAGTLNKAEAAIGALVKYRGDTGELAKAVGIDKLLSGEVVTDQAKSLHKQWETFTKDASTGKLVWDLMVWGASTAADAYAKAWAQYRLADDIGELGEANKGLYADLASDDAAKRDSASAFIQLHQANAGLEKTYDEYLEKLKALTGEALTAKAKKSLGPELAKDVTKLNAEIARIAAEISKKGPEDDTYKVAYAAIAKSLALSKGGGDMFVDSGAKSEIFGLFSAFEKTHSGTRKTKETNESYAEKGLKAITPREEEAEGLMAQIGNVLEEYALKALNTAFDTAKGAARSEITKFLEQLTKTGMPTL